MNVAYCCWFLGGMFELGLAKVFKIALALTNPLFGSSIVGCLKLSCRFRTIGAKLSLGRNTCRDKPYVSKVEYFLILLKAFGFLLRMNYIYTLC